MSVWKNRNTWRWRFFVDGVEFAGSGRTRAEATENEARARTEVAAGRTGCPIKRTIDEALAWYLSSPECLALKSSDDLHLKAAHWGPYSAGKLLTQAPQAAQEAIRTWHAAGLKPATINRRLALLRRVLNLAYRRWDWLREPIADKIQLLPGETEREIFLSETEAVLLRRAIRHSQARAWVSLLVYSGMRPGELAGLRASQIRNGKIYLDARTKTGKPRVVPILPPGTRYLRHVPLQLTYQGLRRHFEAARAAIGRPELRLHDLRHTLASWLANSGATSRDMQVWLGHTNPATTARYSHLEPGRLEVTARKLLAERAERKDKRLKAKEKL